jgi:hypothetical protein
MWLPERGALPPRRRSAGRGIPSTAPDCAQSRIDKLKAELAERGCTWDEEARGWRRPKHRRRDWLERTVNELDAASERANAAWIQTVAKTFGDLD